MRKFAVALVLALVTGTVAAGERLGPGDPTEPTGLPKPGAAATRRISHGRWELQSVLIAPNRAVAVINGRTLEAGERIDGARLLTLRTDGVTLEADGERHELRLSRKSFKSPVSP